jgi:WD40 repeat protein
MPAISFETVSTQGEGHGERLAVGPNGRAWAAATSARLHIWEGDTLAYTIDTVYPAGGLHFSDDGRYLYAGSQILDLEARALVPLPSLRESLIAGLPPGEAPPSRRFSVHGAAWTRDGRDLVISVHYRPPRLRGSVEHFAGPRRRVLLLDGLTRALKAALWEANAPEIRAVAGGHGAVAAAHSSVLLWDRESYQLVGEGREHKFGVIDLCFSGDDIWLASTDWAGRVVIRETRSFKPIANWTAHSDAARAVDLYRPGSLVATGGADAEIKLWLIERKPQLVASMTAQGEVVALAFYPDGERFLAADAEGNIFRCTLSA